MGRISTQNCLDVLQLMAFYSDGFLLFFLVYVSIKSFFNNTILITELQGGAKKWNIHALRRYLLNTGFVLVDY